MGAAGSGALLALQKPNLLWVEKVAEEKNEAPFKTFLN